MASTLRAGGRTLLFTAAVTAISAALLQPSVAAQDRQAGGVGLTVFADPDFRGQSATFRDDVSDLRQVRMNDRITSVAVGRGEVWEVCENVNFGGRCQILSGEESDLRRVGWNDNISSARLVRNSRGRDGRVRGPSDQAGRGGIELFSGTGFNGVSRTFDGDVPNLLSYGFNDQAMSLRIGRSETWEICSDANYRKCRVINSSMPDLGQVGMSTRISSLRLLSQSERSDLGRGRQSFPSRARLVLFDQRNFRGQTILVDDDMANFGSFAGRAESMQVEGGTWEVCTGSGFRGRCTTLSGDVADLGSIGLRNNVSSARPLRNSSSR